MARDKKAKKGLEEETGEEVVSKNVSKESTPDNVATGKSAKKGKKGKKDSIDHVLEDDDVALEEKVQTTKKTKKSKNFEDVDDADDQRSKSITSTSTVDEDSKKEKRSKKSKPATDSNTAAKSSQKKKRGSEMETFEDSDVEDDRTSTRQKSDKPAGFGLLDIEGDDMDDHDKTEEPTATNKLESVPVTNGFEDSKKGGKKSKKKDRKKKNDDDDEDLDKLLAELALEMNGEQTEQAAEPVKTDLPSTESAVPDVKTKKKKKKGADMETSSNLEEREPSVEVGDEDQSTQKTAAQKKKKEKKIADVPKAVDDEMSENLESAEPSAEMEEEQQSTVKTAAQKKKEKKEREKQKKAAQFEQQGRPTKKTVDESKPPKAADVATDAVVAETEVLDADDGKDDGEGDDRKKKKKKKKDDDDDKKDKKRPGKRQIAAMQEALKKVREEEERLRLEEEAKIKAAEEAEILRQEKLRLEQERKEKKKQKEKEKRERLKAEGKLLSKNQRQNRARMEATLAALRQQGVEVPQIGEKKEKVPRLGDRKRSAKKRAESSQEEDKDENVTMDTKETSPEVETIEEKMEEDEAPIEEEEEEDDAVKDAWDESSDEEEESEVSSKVEMAVKDKAKAKHNVEDSESEDSESTDDDSDYDESSSESEGEGKRNEEKLREKVLERIRKRREDNEATRSTSKLRSPVVCVLGHVDTGKTKILDKIRRTNVQDGEAGGITQQIGATMVPQDALKEQCKMVKNFTDLELKLPGLLIIDTPGHESFSNLRSRGSSLCDIAILVVDIMHGLEPQTIESINLLKQKKTPFIVALNKVDRLYEWKPQRNKDIQDVIKSQARNTKMEFDDRAKDVILQFATQGLNAVLHYENTDPRSYISMVPTSAFSGDGMGNLMALVVQLTQSMMMKRLAFSEELQATVLEVKAIPGLGTTIDAILVNGRLREGDTIVLAGYEGAIVTQIRSCLMPQPLKELRVKNFYQEFKEVEGSQGVKIAAKDLDKTIAGLQLLVANHPDETAVLKEEVTSSFKEAMSAIKVADRGVYVQASTLGSLEALLDFLRTSKIPYSGIRIGPVVKKDVMKASIMLEHDSQYAVILAFDVKIERDAQDLADSLGVKIFQADIIYHLFDKFMAYREELKNKKREEFKNVAIFPCKLRILPQFIFNSRDPIVVGVMVEAGVVKEGTPICVPSKEFLEIGTVTTIEVNHKAMETARKGQEVCLKIEPSGGEAPKMYGRHFDHTDILMSKITRQSIDVCKEYFRDDLQKTDWQLMVELKKIFQIL